MVEKNQWFRLSVVLLLALIARVALADKKAEVTGPQRPARTLISGAKKGGHPMAAPASHRAPAAHSTRETVQTKSFPVELSVGPGLSIFRSETGFLFNIGATTPVSRKVPIHVGLDFGMSFWSPTLSNVTGIQLLATGLYKFEIPNARTVHPYAGLSLGPNIMSVSLDSRVTALTGIKGDTEVKFELLFRPGVAFDVSRVVSLSVEPKLGLLDGDFIFNPSVGAVFAL